MKTRKFATSGRDVSEIGLGTWQLGASDWGKVTSEAAHEIMLTAVRSGITFFDTADIYGAGTSERRIGAFLTELSRDPDPTRRQLAAELFVATKFGRASEPGGPANFTYAAMRKHAEQSLANLGRNCLNLTQTHCLSEADMKSGTIFSNLRRLKREGLIAQFGASVETVEEGLTCLEVEELSSLQVIFNVFRQKPAELLFERAAARQVAIIVRLPLASGLLGGQMTAATSFEPSDHRLYNRDGQAFNVGETFAGLGFEAGLRLAERTKPLLPAGMTMPQFAVRFCLDFPAVTTVIPGASRAAQVSETALASHLPPLSLATHNALRRFYEKEVRSSVRGRY